MSEYVPISELGEESENSQVRWAFALPPSLDVERITVNMERLHHLQRLGGIAASVVCDYQGERTEYTPGISGINADGTAIVTKVGSVHKAQQTDTHIVELFPPQLERQFGKIMVGHRINKAELAGNISEKVRFTDKRREDLWASQLDQALRQSFREAGKENLISRNKLWMQAIDSAWLTSAASSVLSEALTQQPSAWFAVYPAAWSFNLGLQLFINRKLFDESLIGQRRWSLAPNSFQPDRYFALSALSRVPGLIKAKK